MRGGGKQCDFWPICRCEIGLRLLLIINRTSYTGSRLPPILKTLDDLERLNRGFYFFFGDRGLRDTFQEQIVLKPIKIDMDTLRMKFLALNADFDGLSLNFLRSRKPAHEGIKKRYPRESRYFTEFANRNCYRLSRVSWALAQISCFLFTPTRFCLVCFPQVVQKQPMDEVKNWVIIWWQVVSGIFAPKIIRIW